MEAVLTHHLDINAPLNLQAYRAAGGYRSLNAAFDRKPEEIIETVEAANLRGRGGAGFSCGLKWRLRGADAPRPRYLICNIDESEPGTFKDRHLLYGGPHQIIEAVIVSAYALQAEQAVIFVRGEYAKGGNGLRRALEEAEIAGLVGTNIGGNGFDLQIEVHVSGGRYICGEETAMLNAIEGRRPNPRPKIPRPSVKGLWGYPTTTNNVETLVNVPHILLNGAAWFHDLGVNGGCGTKLFCVSGMVQHPGLFELPCGTSARELIFEHAGGLAEGRTLLGFLPGGASTAFLLPEHLDVPMDFDPVAKAGSRLGTGSIIVLDDTTCPVQVTLNLMRFFARESCGFCTPCRDGLPYLAQILTAIAAGEGQAEDLALLEELSDIIGPQSFCAFAPGAVTPLISSLQGFRKHYESHIATGRCPFDAADRNGA
ncbi:complex I 51 kDa subunit family protein [Nitrosomonas ureae]|uniref:NADH dehydrogenase subunit F n=1 Tax=Nitrosomonas ureae TaxID=44577 RepID=A0A1H5X9U9_9PROT|nr:NADH-ubiquinone oxidoreductase-F iron-sulfur binding region domain-containing protein [Nitrosomonas ureae]SEG08220.1 NADH dehydrogenase subunit F [Nitrosomonas ureae]